MTMDRTSQSDRVLAGLLVELADARTPDYLEAAIEQASSRPQRPTWTYPGRWLPMDISAQAMPGARLPWRPLAILTLIGLLVVAGLTVYAGARARQPAPPFGRAANGLIAYVSGTDIMAADPRTGATRALASASGAVGPRFSPDGTQLAFERPIVGAGRVSHVVVADVASGQTRVVTKEPVTLSIAQGSLPYAFSPDGRTLAIAATKPEGGPGVLLARTDGTGQEWLDLAGLPAGVTNVREPSFRPTQGAELLFVGDTGGSPLVMVVDLASHAVRTLVRTVDNAGLDMAHWSPDGASISYTTWSTEISGPTVRTHIVRADGTGDRVLPMPEGAQFDIGAAWSNDGTRMLVVRGFTAGSGDTRAAIVPTDGSGTGVELPYDGPIQGDCCYAWQWAPDDTLILGKPITPAGVPGQQVLVDVASATIKTAPWNTTADPVWQRVAP